MKFNDEDKEVREFSANFFKYGVHKVQISRVTLDETDAGKEFVEFEVVDPENGEITDTARCWFVGGATNISFNTIRQIILHNVPEARRDEMAGKVDSAPDTVALVGICQGLIGKECWFTKYPSPDRTYTAKDGTTKPSIDKNVLGYEPKLREDLLPEQKPGTGPVDLGALGVGQEVPFESAGDAPGSKAASETVPNADDWDK